MCVIGRGWDQVVTSLVYVLRYPADKYVHDLYHCFAYMCRSCSHATLVQYKNDKRIGKLTRIGVKGDNCDQSPLGRIVTKNDQIITSTKLLTSITVQKTD